MKIFISGSNPGSMRGAKVHVIYMFILSKLCILSGARVSDPQQPCRERERGGQRVAACPCAQPPHAADGRAAPRHARARLAAEPGGPKAQRLAVLLDPSCHGRAHGAGWRNSREMAQKPGPGFMRHGQRYQARRGAAAAPTAAPLRPALRRAAVRPAGRWAEAFAADADRPAGRPAGRRHAPTGPAGTSWAAAAGGGPAGRPAARRVPSSQQSARR